MKLENVSHKEKKTTSTWRESREYLRRMFCCVFLRRHTVLMTLNRMREIIEGNTSSATENQEHVKESRTSLTGLIVWITSRDREEGDFLFYSAKHINHWNSQRSKGDRWSDNGSTNLPVTCESMDQDHRVQWGMQVRRRNNNLFELRVIKRAFDCATFSA